MNLPNPVAQDLSQYDESTRARIKGLIEEDAQKRKDIMKQVAKTFDRNPVILGAVGQTDGLSLTLES